MNEAFSGTRVIDLSNRLSGAWAARQFADYGAEVIMVESKGGHALRHEPPYLDDTPGMDSSLLHAYVNWNKQSVRDPDSRTLIELVSSADILVTTAAPPWDDALSALVEALPPGAVHLSITPHGLAGPLSSVRGNHLTHCARTGWSFVNGLQNEPPLQLPGRQSGYIAGIAGYVAAAAAWFRSRESGAGERVDVSELEALASTSAPWAILGLFFQSPRVAFGPGGPRFRDTPGPLWKTADGLINYGFGEWGQWREAMELFGLTEIGNDPRYVPVLGRHGQDLRPVAQALAEASLTRGKWDLFFGLADLHCISGVVQNTRDLVDNAQLNARRFFIETTPKGKPLAAPGAAAKLDASPARYQRPAPRLDEHGELRRERRVPNDSTEPQLPLAGIRVLTFTQAWSGTFGTEILSLLGADVIQVEGRKRPDVWRGAGAPVPRGVLDPEREQSPLNTNGMYNSVNLNKRAITLDMTQPRGREIFWKMLPAFDILAENFSPKVMGNWGITMASLREARPDIIFASLSGYGQDGPLASYPANGNTTEPMSGFASVNGYVGDEGANTGGLIPDPISGYYFAGAVMAALHHRSRTGEGQRIDLSMMESVAVQLGEKIMAYAANGEIARPEGNRHPVFAPHSVYPTADDGWIAIAVEDDGQFRALASLAGIDVQRFATMESRKAGEEELDALVAGWCADKPAAALEEQLTSAGVCAAALRGFLDVYADPSPQFLSREYLVKLSHPESGTHFMPTLPWVLARAPRQAVRYSPCFGEHSREVFREELGTTDAEYDELENMGISGMTRL